MGVFPHKIFSQKAWSMVAISARVAPRWGSRVSAPLLAAPLMIPWLTAQDIAGLAQSLSRFRSP